VKGKCNYLKLIKRPVYSVNEHFFDTWSKDMTYILGFTVGDGSVANDEKSSRYRLDYTIHKKDVEILDFIASKLCPGMKFYSFQDMLTARFTSKHLITTLATYGIVPRKTGKEQFPNIPTKYFYDFIRGYLDADGTVCYNADANRIGVNICASSMQVLKDIMNTANIGTLQDKSQYHSCEFWTWEIRRKADLKFLFENLYKPDDFYLKRKYNKFRDWYDHNYGTP
jgi:intein-encoded DNA endonuclease-like protein